MYTKTIRNLTYEICDDYAVVWKCDKNATSVVIAETIESKPVTEIGNSAFAWCTSLKAIIIPDSVTEIGAEAFFNCKSLKEITIPDSVTQIGVSAFTWCKSLESIRIPNSVTQIGNYAFWSCKSLTEITIPDNIEQINQDAFINCPNIQKVKFSQALINRTDSKKIFEQMINAGLQTYEVIFKEPTL